MNCVYYETITGRWTTENSACMQYRDAEARNSVRFVWIVRTDACLVPSVGIVNINYVCGIESDGRHTHSRTGRCIGNYRPWQWGRIESYGHIDLHTHCYARVCIIHGEPKSKEERWCVGQNRVAQTFSGKKGWRERGSLWTSRVKYTFGQHLHSGEYLMLPFLSTVEGVSALILNRV
jgi:hypothetical protein